MAAQAARLFALYLDVTGGASYSAIAGLRSRSVKLDSEFVDITNSDSVNQWREGIANAGVKSIEMSGSGIFLDDTPQATMISVALLNTIRNWRLVHPNLGTFEGPFFVSSFEFTGDYNAALEFNITLMSSGAITFTAS
jgi:TP901-1 family phage major tail protein